MECKSHKVLFQINNNVFELYFEEDRIKEYHPIQLYFENPQTPIDLSEYILEECEIEDIKDVIKNYYQNHGLIVDIILKFPLTAYNILSYLTASNRIDLTIDNIKTLIDIYKLNNYITKPSLKLNIPELLKKYLEKNHKDVDKTIIRDYYYQWIYNKKLYDKLSNPEKYIDIKIKYLYNLPAEYDCINNTYITTYQFYLLHNNNEYIKINPRNILLLRYCQILSPHNVINIIYNRYNDKLPEFRKVPIKNILFIKHYIPNKDIMPKIMLDTQNNTINITYITKNIQYIGIDYVLDSIITIPI